MKYIVMISITLIVMNVSDAHAATVLAEEVSQTFGLKMMLFVLACLGYVMIKQED
ncbi:MAG: hypothetical protein Q9M75_03180 [Ghiorsea sp.]|nr:hypothetical protein [Ghiorsea sp.]MDQ6980575.1 hypothetical protein [Ghiorsea sp.]MDQ7058949.1 hypothetical protein [Ghiorsea sp.]